MSWEVDLTNTELLSAGRVRQEGNVKGIARVLEERP